MKARVALLCLLVTGAVAQGRPPPEPAASSPAVGETLRWHNGETLPGEIIAASADDLIWKSPLFEDPLVLGWRVLDRIDQPLPTVAPADTFAFTLRDGSHLYGELAAVTDSTVSISSSRHGDVSIERSELLNMRRIKGSGVIFAGPSGDVGWNAAEVATGKRPGTVFRVEPSAGSPAVPPLIEGAGGALLIPYWNRGAFLALSLPNSVEVEFRVHSSKRPDFSLTLDGEPKGDVRIETWGDELVLVDVDEFRLIRKLAESERDVALRVCWDREAQRCDVYSAEGDRLLAWQGLGNTASVHAGITLQNKGRDLSLDLLRVRAWNGQPPSQADMRQPRVELTDGRSVTGQVGAGSGQSIALAAGVPDLIEMVTGIPPAGAKFPLDDVDEIVFSGDPLKISQAQPALSYADATVLMGRIAAVKDGTFALETSFTQAPLASRLEGIRRIVNRLPPAPGAGLEPPLASLDKIVLGQTTLHGRFASAGDDRPRWVPVGGIKPALPVRCRTRPPLSTRAEATCCRAACGRSTVPGRSSTRAWCRRQSCRPPAWPRCNSSDRTPG
jgi:hypothetical protein